MKEEKIKSIKSEVNIIPVKPGGFFIEVNDEYTKNRMAVTREELEKIVLYGEIVLKEKK